jgi:transposase-like protein
VAKPRSYSPEQREEALRLYQEVGPAEAARRLDIPAPTVRKWASRAAISAPNAKQTAAATAAAKLSREERAERLAAEALEAAGEFLARSRDGANPQNALALTKAFGETLRGSQLLAGDPTDRVEVTDLEREIDRELAELSAVRERNTELAAQHNGDDPS